MTWPKKALNLRSMTYLRLPRGRIANFYANFRALKNAMDVYLYL